MFSGHQGSEICTRKVITLTDQNNPQGYCRFQAVEVSLMPQESVGSARNRAVSLFVQQVIVPVEDIYWMAEQMFEVLQWETDSRDTAKRLELIMGYCSNNSTQINHFTDLQCFEVRRGNGKSSWEWYSTDSASDGAKPAGFRVHVGIH